MFDYKNYYKTLNVKVLTEYNETLERIKAIKNKTAAGKRKYDDYFHKVSSFILMMADFEIELNDKYFDTNNMDTLIGDNHKFYGDVIGEAYNTSYANPKVCVKKFGFKIGQNLTYLYNEIRQFITYAFEHRAYDMYVWNDIFIRVYNYIDKNRKIDVAKLRQIVISDSLERLELKAELFIRRSFTPEISYYSDVIKECDLNDLRYLFRLGHYISDEEIKLARFINSLPKEKIKEVAHTFTEGFKEGYSRDNKDLGKKESVQIYFHVGNEAIVKEAIKDFDNMGLTSFVRVLPNVEPNKQYPYDHRFDKALHLNRNYARLVEKSFDDTYKRFEQQVNKYGGPAVLEKFGEVPFAPVAKSECLKLNEDQSKIMQEHTANMMGIRNQYLPRSSYSFTIMALPVPEIGEQFEEIFEETCKVNTLDSKLYDKIQKSIIDALDQGQYVHVKGKGDNETDIMVAMQPIENPKKQTNFNNCVADVNIPVGEVFTSPQLTGTNGVLHVEEVFLNDLKYENLKLRFKDGIIESYSCTNFDKENDNLKYIKENLLFPHATLPLGEFAIGTNTTAYVMAEKYGIVQLLPILIVEKMGPHFAVGDTCYSREEDVAVFNPDGKEIMSRENEKSCIRQDDPINAYTNVHTDITLPYDGLEFIVAIKENGDKIEIIRDGRFVLTGTEELNKAFEVEGSKE